MREPGRACDQAWPPAGLAAAVADPLLQLAREQPRRALRSAGAVEQRTRLAAAVEPAMPPLVRRRRRHAEAGRGPLQRQTLLDRAHQREPTSQSETPVTAPARA